ncbi:hypothetical protein KC336_g5676 [Hortaea werneckii]|nr:hypothetical protein KC336_g5676 [Hortaea werneckii]
MYDETECEFWDTSRYDWLRKAKQFRQHDLDTSREGLIKIAVTVQRFVRAGFPGGRPSLDELTAYHHHQSEQNLSDPQILKQWQQRTFHLETNILTVEWVTHAIASGNDEMAKEGACAFDVAYAAEARRWLDHHATDMKMQPSHVCISASDANQRKRRIKHTNASSGH